MSGIFFMIVDGWLLVVDVQMSCICFQDPFFFTNATVYFHLV